jgi:hypothetical protein
MGAAMTRNGHAGWRVLVMAAFAGTAALAVLLTRVPGRPAHAALSAARSPDPCAATGLDAWLGEGAAGHGTSYTLEFTNVSARACSLDGYPEVSAYAGSQVGSPAARDASVPPRPVTLAPGATAHAVLYVTGTARFAAAACGRVTAPDLRVSPPGEAAARPAYLPVRLPACSRPGPRFLSVQPVQARPGVPGAAGPLRG